jgi:hypothetical protein
MAINMACDFYRYKRLVVSYSNYVTEDDVVTIKNFKHVYCDMEYNNNVIFITLTKQPVYCACHMRNIQSPDSYRGCRCYKYEVELLSSDVYSNIFCSLALDNNSITKVERQRTSMRNWLRDTPLLFYVYTL